MKHGIARDEWGLGRKPVEVPSAAALAAMTDDQLAEQARTHHAEARRIAERDVLPHAIVAGLCLREAHQRVKKAKGSWSAWLLRHWQLSPWSARQYMGAAETHVSLALASEVTSQGTAGLAETMSQAMKALGCAELAKPSAHEKPAAPTTAPPPPSEEPIEAEFSVQEEGDAPPLERPLGKCDQCMRRRAVLRRGDYALCARCNELQEQLAPYLADGPFADLGPCSPDLTGPELEDEGQDLPDGPGLEEAADEEDEHRTAPLPPERPPGPAPGREPGPPAPRGPEDLARHHALVAAAALERAHLDADGVGRRETAIASLRLALEQLEPPAPAPAADLDRPPAAPDPALVELRSELALRPQDPAVACRLLYRVHFDDLLPTPGPELGRAVAFVQDAHLLLRVVDRAIRRLALPRIGVGPAIRTELLEISDALVSGPIAVAVRVIRDRCGDGSEERRRRDEAEARARRAEQQEKAAVTRAAKKKAKESQ